MRRVTLWVVSTVAALMLLFSYHTSTGGGLAGTRVGALAPPAPGGTTSATAPSGSDSPAAPSGSSSPAAPSASPTTRSTSGTFTGSSVDTAWGPVQVQVTVRSGKITDVSAVVYPQNNPRDLEINSYALPVLHDEVLQAQSAQIDAVSGATVTSGGYISSLQSALDAAHLGG